MDRRSEKPTVFLYAHHRRPPVHKKALDEGPLEQRAVDADREGWLLYGSGSADDKAPPFITAQLVQARPTQESGSCRSSSKMVVEERRRSVEQLMSFFKKYRRISTPTPRPSGHGDIEVGLPASRNALARHPSALTCEGRERNDPVHTACRAHPGGSASP